MILTLYTLTAAGGKLLIRLQSEVQFLLFLRQQDGRREIPAKDRGAISTSETPILGGMLTDYTRHGMLIRFMGTHRLYDEIEDIENI